MVKLILIPKQNQFALNSLIFQILNTNGEIVKDSAENYFTNYNKSDEDEEEEEELTTMLTLACCLSILLVILLFTILTLLTMLMMKWTNIRKGGHCYYFCSDYLAANLAMM